MKQHTFSGFSVFLLLLLCSFSAQAEITAEASLNAHSFPVDRAAQLVITITGASSADVKIKEIDGLRFHSRGQSSRVNIVNGSYSSSISNNYIVQALQPGTYTIPSISVNAGGKNLQTKPITFEVTPINQKQVKKGKSTGNSSDKEQVAFIRLAKIGRHYNGEIVPVKIKAYFNQKYRANINSLPVLKADGVIMSPLNNEPEQTQEQLKGITYSVLSWNTNLTGIKSGSHSLLFELDATLLLPQQRRSMSSFGGGNFFDDSFLDNFFGGVQRKPITVVSPELQFEVVKLPDKNRPENFTGAIGDFQLSVSASPHRVEIGEPITLTIVIKGKGNFDRVEAPVFPASSDWKTYTATSDYTSQKDISGRKQFEQAIVAKNSKLQQIPSLSFSYFDPEKESYQTVTSAPVAIQIAEPDEVIPRQQAIPTTVSAKPQSSAAPSLPAPDIKGLAPLHLEPGTFHPSMTPVYKKIWFLIAVTGCTFLLLLIVFFRMRTSNLKKHPELQLQKKGRQLLSDNLARLKQAETAGDGAHFLALCRQTIQQQLGLLWKQEPAAISLADIKNRLDGKADLVQIFETAEQAVYGRATLSSETMQIYSKKLKKGMEELL